MNKKEYLAKRKALLEEAESLLNESKLEEFAAKEKEIKDLDAKFEEIAKAQANMNALKGNAFVADQVKDFNDSNVIDKLPNASNETIKLSEERGKNLKMKNAVTVGTSNIVMPQYTADNIRPTFNEVSGLIDRVTIKPLIGGESFKQPYVAGYGEGGYTNEGADYAEAETSFDYAQMNKAKITAYAEDSEEIQKLPDVDYDGEVMKGVRIASRKKIARQILLGAGTTNTLVGIFSTNATAIDADTDLELDAIDNNTLDEIIFSFGGDEDVEDAAVLILNKKDLKAFSKLRTSDGKKFHTIVTNGNAGTIDGIPFIINSACKALSDPSTTVGQYSMAYGPLSNYMLTIFSDMEVKRSDDYKFKQGMIAHRSSVFLGGNVVSKNGFLRIKKAD